MRSRRTGGLLQRRVNLFRRPVLVLALLAALAALIAGLRGRPGLSPGPFMSAE